MFEIRPHPDFSWSISRQRKLDDCPRAYFFHYYGAHNGWLRDAPALAKEAYRLKQLASIDALLGLEMDKRAFEIEAACRAEDSLPSADELEERTRRTLRDAYLTSRSLREEFETGPKSVVMLRSFYLDGEEPSEREVKRVQERLPVCIRNLLDAPDWERVRSCGRDGRVQLDEFMSFALEGVTVYAMPDFAYLHESKLRVIDWKTGDFDPGHEAQPLLSTHCLRERHPELRRYEVQPVLYYLSNGERRVVTMPADLEQYVADTVLPGIRATRTYLRDPADNAPLDITEFPRRESGLCGSCNFRPLCGRGR